MKTFGMSVEYYKLCRHPVFCYYNRKERVENMPKNIAVITGASGGLGREFVRLFTKDDSIQEIWAVARKKDKLEKLQKEFGSKIRIFSYDLSDIEQKDLQKNILKVLFISAIWSIMPAMQNLGHIMIFLYRNHLI